MGPELRYNIVWINIMSGTYTMGPVYVQYDMGSGNVVVNLASVLVKLDSCGFDSQLSSLCP